MKRFIINENEKREIRKLYGLINEQTQLPVTVSGNYSASNCDELHAFQGTGGKTIGNMNGKVQQKISELTNLGLKVKVVDVNVKVNGMNVSWSVIIDKSNDDKNWVGFTSRGAGCNGSITTRWNDENVGNGIESIKNKIKEQGIGVVDQIELVKTFTHQEGQNSFKQGFYRYCLLNQQKNTQTNNPQNQQQNLVVIQGSSLANLRSELLSKTSGTSIDLKSIKVYMNQFKVTYKQGDTKIQNMSIIFDPDKNNLEKRLEVIKSKNQNMVKTDLTGEKDGFHWIILYFT
jgi:hypothetical protein